MAGKEELGKKRDPDPKGGRNSIVPVAAPVGFLGVEKSKRSSHFVYKPSARP